MAESDFCSGVSDRLRSQAAFAVGGRTPKD